MILNLEKLRKDYKKIRRSNSEIAQRLNVLIEYSKIELKFINKKSKSIISTNFLSEINISIRTIQRWKKSYIKNGIKGLRKIKNKGRKAVEIRGHTARIITRMREKYRWGAEVIEAHLKHDHKIIISKFRIHRYLIKKGLIKKYPCTTKKRTKNNKTNKHSIKVVVRNPGDHCQLDVKYLPYILLNNKNLYVYNFIDHASNWSFKMAYEEKGYKETEDFMEKLLFACPFKIKRIQTDGGIEFTSKYIAKFYDDPPEHPLQRICAENDIRHVVIPPGEKELQGLVERSHRQDDQEFYFRANSFMYNAFCEELTEYMKWRNKNRRFKKLNWITPKNYLINFNELLGQAA